MERIGIMGGSFDPVHMGHVIFAEEAVKQLGLDKLFVVPCAESPHTCKEVKTSASDRLAMLDAAFGSCDKCEISNVEVKQQGVSYTIDTINYFVGKYPDSEITLLIGTDLYQTFDTWRNYKEILKKVKVTVILRGESDVEVTDGFSSIKMPLIEVSSTQIREETLIGNVSVDNISQEVLDYIQKNDLYKQEDGQ